MTAQTEQGEKTTERRKREEGDAVWSGCVQSKAEVLGLTQLCVEHHEHLTCVSQETRPRFVSILVLLTAESDFS